MRPAERPVQMLGDGQPHVQPHEVGEPQRAHWMIVAELHRAIDRTAGRVMQRTTLTTLFERAPHLAPQRELIERFYAQSTELFFGRGLPADALSVRELCRELRRLEKRHER